MTPRVSICIPTYNAAAFIERTLQSALAQTLQEIEVVVADDGSTDSTLSLIERCNDSRVRLLPAATREGFGANWNRAVAAAGAPCVKVLCHDDVLLPDCALLQYEALQDPDIAVVGCARQIIDANDRSYMTRRGMRTPAEGLGRAHVARAVVRRGGNLIGEPTATMFRKQDFLQVGGFDDRNPYMIDLDLWMRLLGCGRLRMLPQVLCGFRVSGTSLSTKLIGDQYQMTRTYLDGLCRDLYPNATRFERLSGRFRARLRCLGRQFLSVRMNRP
jgi:glycosyltransferase involved in cell wall biosynthesis